MNSVYAAVLKIKSFCGSCGALILQDGTPIEYTDFEDHFNEIFENGELEEKVCNCCLKNKSRPYLWIGNLKNYFIFPDGKIYSFKHKKMLSPFIDRKGYPAIKIYLGEKSKNTRKIKYVRKNLRIHKIVAMKYLPLYEYEGLLIRHLDDNKLNSHFKNLQWGTPAENSKDYTKNKRKIDYV